VLTKRRPDIRLSIPRVIVPGRPFRVRIHLDCPRAMRIDKVTVELGGRYWNMRQNQYGEQRFDTRFYGRTIDVVAKPTELRCGRHELETTLVVPEHAPSTYRGSRIAVEHFVTVRVDIPWWRDARASFALQVINPGLRSGGERRVWSSDPDGPRARDPYAEFSLSSTELVPSEQVLAVVALSNVELNHYRSIHITLVAFERIRRFLTAKHALAWGRWRIDLENPKENEPVHFRLEVPPSIVPAFVVGGVSVDWFVEFEIDVAAGSSIKGWIPVTICRPEARDDAAATAPPAVGSVRLELLWATVARHLGCEAQGTTLRYQAGSVSVDVRREHRGRHGVYVVADLRYPNLGIGLALENAVDHPRLMARHESQAKWLRTQLGDCLAAAPPRIADDEHMVIELADAGTQARRLHAFVSQVLDVANALDAVNGEIPAPVSMQHSLERWRAAAQSLGASFEAAAVRIRLERERDQLHIRPRWSRRGEPRGIVLELLTAEPIDRRYHVRWDATRALLFEAHDISSLFDDADTGRIDESQVVIERPSMDLEPALGCAAAMLRFADRLSGRRTVYR
jgi:hypothetical protein